MKCAMFQDFYNAAEALKGDCDVALIPTPPMLFERGASKTSGFYVVAKSGPALKAVSGIRERGLKVFAPTAPTAFIGQCRDNPIGMSCFIIVTPQQALLTLLAGANITMGG